MGLSEIADGIEVTDEQDERGISTVDTTDATLTERLEPFADDLPCTPAEAATVLERYSEGKAVDGAGRAAGVAPVTAAKTLHLLGESVSPVGPMGKEIVQDWIAGDLSRTEALELTQLGEAEFGLAAYVETHDPIEDACAAIEGVLAGHRDRRQPLAETMSQATDLL
ncbi:hypothetical protein GRX03_14330 [Halovenus sp. WSH3]|uniref:Uncharacterized protein n=1 Tax=Halovenus carboxidivorans TaxID=2692199 RepID=A0A6B0T3D5_9EURY|nr:hypothetical protein [Halovenus carboxidivorans]MXR52778.1 hypothetical protein [Halovenus carboxidivorans]